MNHPSVFSEFLEFDAFLRSIKQNLDGSFGVLVGAGASISSGVQSADDCIWDWKAAIYQTLSGDKQQIIDPKRSMPSRVLIQQWLDAQHVYPPADDPSEYSFYAEKAYPIETDRVKYFQHLCQDKGPYVGYKLLCLLHKYGVVRSVWSTNFDGLVERAAQQANITPIAINLNNSHEIYRPASSQELLYVALHGDYKYSKLKNTAQELDAQNQNFKDVLDYYFRDKSLIVIGYSGRDQSLMEALKAAFTVRGAGRLYWCGFGAKMLPEVQQLIQDIRTSGREAYYVETDGFDNTMVRLMTYCFGSDAAKQQEIEDILREIPSQTPITPFTTPAGNTHKYSKSNLSPVSLPKSVYQFRIKCEKDQNLWQLLKEKMQEKPLIAVPYKDYVYAISTSTVIQETFGPALIGPIERVPVSLQDIAANTHLKRLFLHAILDGLAKQCDLGVNYRGALLWQQRCWRSTAQYTVHEAIECGLVFLPQFSYALLSFTPTLYIKSQERIGKELKQRYLRQYLDNMRNQAYENKLQVWSEMLYKGAHLQLSLPLHTASPFKFIFSNNRGFAAITVAGEGQQAPLTPPRDYSSTQTIFQGLQIAEPQLEFQNALVDKPYYDTNPMKGLYLHKPFDSKYYERFPQDIRLGVICPSSYSNDLHRFLHRLETRIQAPRPADYLQDYLGFQATYKCHLEIPEITSDRWVSISDHPKEIHSLAETICNTAEGLSSQYPGMVLIIFIPAAWSSFRQSQTNGEAFDLHNYIKASAARARFTTQLIEEDTLKSPMQCEVSWWLSLALFVKAMRTPWTLAGLDPNTAYAGIGYSIKKQPIGKSEVVLGCCHIYNAQGQGLRYKLSKVEHPQFDRKRNPYLTFEEAFQFGMNILTLFQQAMEKLPSRVVIHKRTPFTQDEVDGITNALKQANITSIDLITIAQEQRIRFIAHHVNYSGFQAEGYPISRGTCIPLSPQSALLWTQGTVPSIIQGRKYYQGGRSIPSPLKITKYYGDGALETIAKEILSFTKMNWNSFNLYTKLPATIDTSNTLAQVGNLLRQYKGITYDYRYFI